MAICAAVVDGVVSQTGIDPNQCSDYVLMTANEYSAHSADFYNLLDSLFSFDPAICGIVVGSSLVMWMVSYGAGNVVRWLGR